MSRFGYGLVTCLLFLHVSVQADDSLQFTSTNLNGGQVAVQTQQDPCLYVVCFLGAECPMARVYAERLEAMAQQLQGDGVRFIGVNSNRQDSINDVREYVDVHGLTFPFVKDKDNVIADRYGAERTPEVFVLDQALSVRYRGRIDDQYAPGISRHEPGSHDLRRALDELLAGKSVSTPSTTALGCRIGKVARGDAKVIDNDVTYTSHVAAVLNRHCVECHTQGEIGPFAMDSFDEVIGWADTMMETIDNGRMPPWHADPAHGDFANERHMPEADKQIIRDWIDGGLKRGNPKDLPPTPEFNSDWQLGSTPDRIVPMRSRPFTVPRDGVVEYQYYVADPNFTEDTWISGAQVRPGARSVVHHAIVYVRPPDGSPMPGIGWLTAYVPGQRLVPLPPGRARFVPAGSRLVFQMHYTPNGRQTDDISEIGLWFSDDSEVTHEVFTLAGLNQEFTIPPNEPAFPVEGEVPWLPDDGELLGIAPHMHFRGKAFRVFESGKKSSPLLNVPNYDFNWQHSYMLRHPIPMKDLAGLRFEATFDNSSNNPFNPEPNEWVSWGDQTWEEMAIAFFEVAQPRGSGGTGRLMGRTSETIDPAIALDEFIAEWLSLDANKDGRIVQDEAPIVVRFFTFDRLDVNGDGSLTEEELRRRGKRLFR